MVLPLVTMAICLTIVTLTSLISRISMSRWVNSSGSRHILGSWWSISAVLTLLGIVLLSGCIQIWPFWTESTDFGIYSLKICVVNDTGVAVSSSLRFGSPSMSFTTPNEYGTTGKRGEIRPNKTTEVTVRFAKKDWPRQADGLFLIENTSDESRRVFVVQTGGAKKDRLAGDRQLEQLGIKPDQLFENLSERLKAGGAAALTAYWEEVHRLRLDIALLIPPKSTVALPWC